MHLRALLICITAPVLLVGAAERHPRAVAEIEAVARGAMSLVM